MRNEFWWRQRDKKPIITFNLFDSLYPSYYPRPFSLSYLPFDDSAHFLSTLFSSLPSLSRLVPFRRTGRPTQPLGGFEGFSFCLSLICMVWIRSSGNQDLAGAGETL